MTKQVDIIKDLGTYTRVPGKILNELVDRTNLCIGNAIHDAKIAKEPATILDIGIGTLSVELETMQCKFIPSKDLKKVIKESTSSEDPMIVTLETALVEKLTRICEEVI